MNNLKKAFFAVLCFAIAGNALAMDNQKGKRERDEQNEHVYYAIRTRPGFTPKNNSSARVKELINSAKRIVAAGVDLPTMYADFKRILDQQVETESDEFAIIHRLATIRDVATEDDVVVMEQGGLSGEETEDQDDIAANALVAMRNQ